MPPVPFEDVVVPVVVVEVDDGDDSLVLPWPSALTVVVDPPQAVSAAPINAASASAPIKRVLIAEMVLTAVALPRRLQDGSRRPEPALGVGAPSRGVGRAGHGYYHPGMAGTTGQPDTAPKGDQQAKRRSRGELSRTIAVLVLALAVILFAVKNLDQVKVNWVVGSGRAPLIIVILITLLVGMVISHLGGRLSRRKQKKDVS